ncbi:MAG: MmgE/PrpD family protein, partial [Gammaproteobacteria bacterium]
LSFASGSMAFVADNTWTKRLHPGWAAAAGITAAAFAAAGYVGPGAPLEGRFGLYETLLGAAATRDLDAFGDDLGHTWRTLGVAFKPYPACHFNHAFAECALALRADGLRAEDVAQVTALVHPDQVPVVCEPLAAKQAPARAYDAQFSVPWTVAACLRHGRFTLAELTDDALADPATRALAARVGHADDPDSRYPEYYSGGLVVTTRDGRTLRHHVAVNRGTREKPMSEQEILDKFHANAARSIPRAAAARIATCVRGLATAPDLDALAAALAVTAGVDAGT